MAGTVFSQQKIERPRQFLIARETFQLRAEIMGRSGAGNPGQILDRRKHIPIKQRPRRVGAPIQINCGQHGLERIHEQTLLGSPAGGFLPPAQLQVAAEIEFVRRREQVVRTHQMVLEKGKLAFVELAKAGEQPLAYEPAQYGITQELKAFVIGARLRGVA